MEPTEQTEPPLSPLPTPISNCPTPTATQPRTNASSATLSRAAQMFLQQAQVASLLSPLSALYGKPPPRLKPTEVGGAIVDAETSSSREPQAEASTAAATESPPSCLNGREEMSLTDTEEIGVGGADDPVTEPRTPALTASSNAMPERQPTETGEVAVVGDGSSIDELSVVPEAPSSSSTAQSERPQPMETGEVEEVGKGNSVSGSPAATPTPSSSTDQSDKTQLQSRGKADAGGDAVTEHQAAVSSSLFSALVQSESSLREQRFGSMSLSQLAANQFPFADWLLGASRPQKPAAAVQDTSRPQKPAAAVPDTSRPPKPTAAVPDASLCNTYPVQFTLHAGDGIAVNNISPAVMDLLLALNPLEKHRVTSSSLEFLRFSKRAIATLQAQRTVALRSIGSTSRAAQASSSAGRAVPVPRPPNDASASQSQSQDVARLERSIGSLQYQLQIANKANKALESRNAELQAQVDQYKTQVQHVIDTSQRWSKEAADKYTAGITLFKTRYETAIQGLTAKHKENLKTAKAALEKFLAEKTALERTLRTEINTLRTEKAALERELDGKTALLQPESALTNVKAAIADSKRELDEVERRHANRKAVLEKLEDLFGDHAGLRKRIQDLVEDNAKLSSELDSLKVEKVAPEKEVPETTAGLLPETNLDNLTTPITSSRREPDEVEQRRANTQAEPEKLEQRHGDLSSLAKRLEDLVEDNVKLSSEVNSLKSEVAALQKNVIDNKIARLQSEMELAASESAIATITTELEELKRHNGDRAIMTKRIEDLVADKARLSSELDVVKGHEAKLLDSLNTVLGNNLSHVFTLLGEQGPVVTETHPLKAAQQYTRYLEDAVNAYTHKNRADKRKGPEDSGGTSPPRAKRPRTPTSASTSAAVSDDELLQWARGEARKGLDVCEFCKQEGHSFRVSATDPDHWAHHLFYRHRSELKTIKERYKTLFDYSNALLEDQSPSDATPGD